VLSELCGRSDLRLLDRPDATPIPGQPPSPFKGLNSSPVVIRPVVLMHVRFPLTLRNVEDLLFEHGIDLCQETVRFWWNKFGPLFAPTFVVSGSAACGGSATGSGIWMKLTCG